MSDGRLDAVLRYLRRKVRQETGCGTADADLLARWVTARDEAAFELLLYRHGPMVLGVCRRLLRREPEVDDAFQATFLALVRKAASIRRGASLAGWLYRVAYRAALRARSLPSARTVSDIPDLKADPTLDHHWREVRRVLDEEISRLPERYRVPFVLCHLQGRTNEEAARELDRPVGTVLSRLARARERLRARLTRRGVTLTAGMITAILSEQAIAGPISPERVGAALRVTLPPPTGLPPAVESLTQGILKEMMMAKLRVAVLLLPLGLLGAGAGLLAYQPGDPGQQVAAQEVEGRTAPKAKEPAKPQRKELSREEETQRQREMLDKARAQTEEEWLTGQRHMLDLQSAFERQMVERQVDVTQLQEAIRAIEQDVNDDRKLERNLLNAAKEKQERLLMARRDEETSQQLKAVMEQIGNMLQNRKGAESQRMEQLGEARRKLARAQAELGRMERSHALERQFMQIKLEAVETRLRTLLGVGPQSDNLGGRIQGLEQKLDHLLREVVELRKKRWRNDTHLAWRWHSDPSRLRPGGLIDDQAPTDG